MFMQENFVNFKFLFRMISIAFQPFKVNFKKLINQASKNLNCISRDLLRV